MTNFKNLEDILQVDLQAMDKTTEGQANEVANLSQRNLASDEVSVKSTLSEDELEMAKKISEGIDVTNASGMIEYGTQAQNQLTSFSNTMLDEVRNNETGEIGEILNDLMVKISSVNPDKLVPVKKEGFFKRLFNKAKNNVDKIISQYQTVADQISKISYSLEQSKDGLLRDLDKLSGLYEQNVNYYKAINVYIAAAEIKREELINDIIPKLEEKAKQSGDQMDVQKVNDVIAFLDRLDKRIYDLKLSRQITLQTAPQIRLIQQTNQVLAEKIQSSIVTSIPLWRNQFAVALTLRNQNQALQSQKLVSDTTNDLLLKNSEMLKQNTIETAKENERGLVEIETLRQTQENLIETIETTLDIQREGSKKRMEAEKQLVEMEKDLKQRLLQSVQNR